MMKYMVITGILFQVNLQYAEFILQTIENRSDLQFNRAYHKNLGKEKNLPSLTDILQKSNNKQHVVVDKTIGSNGLGIVMSDNKGHKATIFIHDQVKHSIEYKRKKIQQIASFPPIVSTGEGDYSAQIMLQDLADSKMLAEPKSYNHQENGRFNMIISGSLGNYQISLHPTA